MRDKAASALLLELLVFLADGATVPLKSLRSFTRLLHQLVLFIFMTNRKIPLHSVPVFASSLYSGLCM